MKIIIADMEGVFTPEIWINVSEKTGIKELRLTTRDEPDYNKLMKMRIKILEENRLKLKDIQEVIAMIDLLPGSKDFLYWLKERCPVIIVSDTFTQFAGPLMKKLDYPTLMCNSLVIDDDGRIIDFSMRQEDGKRKVAEALRSLNYEVIAFGDSYNDIGMLKAADKGILFCPPVNVKEEFTEFPVAEDYGELKKILGKYL